MSMTPTPLSRGLMLALLGCCVISLIIGLIQTFSGQAQVSQRHTGSSKKASAGLLSENHLALISLQGMIAENEDDSGLFKTESAALKARRLLYEAADDSSVKGILIRINSPGGTVGMSQELYNAVSYARKQKPVVVSMGDLAASGGYYTAAAADWIVCNPGTLTASIGVIIQSMNLHDLLTKKLGVNAVTIKSGKFKDILSPYRPGRPEETAMIQSIIDTSYRQFIGAVVEGRTRILQDPKKKAEREKSLRAIADGRVVIGEEGLKVGLVDQLGGLEDAKKALQKLASKRFDIRNPENLSLDDYGTPVSFWQVLGMESSLGKGKLPQTTVTLGVFDTWLSHHMNQPLWLMDMGGGY